MFVAKAVFPIEGRPASIIKSEFCNPPNFLSMSINPEGIPDTPCISESKALLASSIASVAAFTSGSKFFDWVAKRPANFLSKVPKKRKN